MAEIKPVTIPLTVPVTHGDAVYHQLTLRMPTIGDQVDSWQPGMSIGEGEVALAAHLCDVPVEAMRRVFLGDYRRLQEVMQNFPLSPETKPAAGLSGSPDTRASTSEPS